MGAGGEGRHSRTGLLAVVLEGPTPMGRVWRVCVQAPAPDLTPPRCTVRGTSTLTTLTERQQWIPMTLVQSVV